MSAAAPVHLPAWWRVGTEFRYFVGLMPVLGGLLVLCLGTSLYTAHQVSRLLVRRATLG